MIPVFFVFVSLFIIVVSALECEDSPDLVPSSEDLKCYKLSNENLECRNDEGASADVVHQWKTRTNSNISTDFDDPAGFGDFPLQVIPGSHHQWVLRCNRFTADEEFEKLVSDYPFLRGIVVSAVGFRTTDFEIMDEHVHIGVANEPEFSTRDLALNESWPRYTGNIGNMPRRVYGNAELFTTKKYGLQLDIGGEPHVQSSNILHDRLKYLYFAIAVHSEPHSNGGARFTLDAPDMYLYLGKTNGTMPELPPTVTATADPNMTPPIGTPVPTPLPPTTIKQTTTAAATHAPTPPIVHTPVPPVRITRAPTPSSAPADTAAPTPNLVVNPTFAPRTQLPTDSAVDADSEHKDQSSMSLIAVTLAAFGAGVVCAGFVWSVCRYKNKKPIAWDKEGQ